MLCTRLALAIWIDTFVVRVRAGAEVAASPRLDFRVHKYLWRSKTKLYTKRGWGAPRRKVQRDNSRSPEPQTVAAVEAWALAHDVSRSEAIRRLVELGLRAKGK